MGMLRKMTSLCSAGLLASYHSPRENRAIAAKREARASKISAKAQRQAAKNGAQPQFIYVQAPPPWPPLDPPQEDVGARR